MNTDNKTILIVEDESSLSDALSDKLHHEKFTVLTAKNGEEGLAIALSKKPDLILLDIIMPKKNGFVMMENLRASNDYGKNVPIIILTNLSSDSEKVNQEITDYEPTYYLVKTDWKIQDVVEKIKEKLSK